MRGVVLLPFVIGACTADIAPDTYFCGPERLCPEGLACNDADNICTVPSAVESFGCGEIGGVPIPDLVGDDTPGEGLDVTNVNTCTIMRELRACLFDEDPGDWFQFDLAAGSCGGDFTLVGKVTYAVAFEPMAIHLSTNEGTPEVIDVECEDPTEIGGQTQRCFEVPITGGAHYSVGVLHSDRENCGGDCSHNRYILDLRLTQ
jgi:hypothetical protein